jgi:hypothetical protein
VGYKKNIILKHKWYQSDLASVFRERLLALSFNHGMAVVITVEINTYF